MPELAACTRHGMWGRGGLKAGGHKILRVGRCTVPSCRKALFNATEGLR